MVKQITDLTLADFPNVYTLNGHVRLATNIPNLDPSLLGSKRNGYYILVFNNSDTIPKIKNIYLSPQVDIYASDNTSSLSFPNSSNFREVSSLYNNKCITSDTLHVGGMWFNDSSQKIVWAYFVTDDTPDLEHIAPSLKADNVSVQITGNTVTLTANAGYKIKNATLDIGSSLFGDDTHLDFTVSQDKNTATLTVTDDNLIDASQEYNLTVHTDTVPTQPYTLQDVGLQCDNENVTLSVTNNTATLTAKSGYKITSATITSKNKNDFSGSTRQDHNFTISEDGSNATITLVPTNNLNYTLNVSCEPSEPSEPVETNYKVDIFKIKDYVDYTTDKAIITLTAKQNVTINTLSAVADLTWSGDTYQLDNNAIKIADNKKTATITVPNEYNSKLGYTIVISGDFTKNTPILPNPKATGTLHVYQLDDKALEDFSTKAIETFNSGHNEVYDFQKFITQLYTLPFFVPETESSGTTNILTGWYTINEPARLLNKTHYIKDFGNIKVLPVNNNGYDHNVTNCTLYLPFVSPISVSYETVLNRTVNIKYDTDLAGAKTTVNIFVDKELYKTIQVSIIENLDLYNIYNDSINGSLSSILNNTLDHCFIKVEYNKPVTNLVSYETLEHNTLSNYTNFVKTQNATVTCGTQQEQIEIENLLNRGIYIK